MCFILMTMLAKIKIRYASGNPQSLSSQKNDSCHCFSCLAPCLLWAFQSGGGRRSLPLSFFLHAPSSPPLIDPAVARPELADLVLSLAFCGIIEVTHLDKIRFFASRFADKKVTK